MLGEDETKPILLEITLPQHPVNSVPQLWLVFSPYQGDNIKNPPLVKSRDQNIWPILENNKSRKKTFENFGK